MIIERLIDRVPILARLARGSFGAAVRLRIIQVFPGRSATERESILRGYLRYRLMNRALYKLTMRFPALAALLSRSIPVAGRSRLERANGDAGPIVLATAHFGSLYFQMLIYRRFMRGRRIFMMHERDFVDAQRDQTFLKRLGIVPVPNDARGLRTLIRALNAEPHIAIVMAFDPTMGTRHAMRFLGTTVPVAMGMGLLADIGHCRVIPVFWHFERWLPRVTIDDFVSVDYALTVAQRRIALVEQLYGRLESRVAQYPEQWMLWEFIRDVPSEFPEPSTET